MKSLAYDEQDGSTSWLGVGLAAGDEFDAFMAASVAERLHDLSGLADFSAHLSGLATTGFGLTSLQAVLDAEHAEERDWAIGEALAEAWLTHDYGVVWPWNMALDKRTPNASLPGPDLIGFVTQADKVRLVLGEVKSSSHAATPPGVMTGRTGMTQQLEQLVSDLSLLFQLLRWLHPRCNTEEKRELFSKAVALFLASGNKEVALFGVLVRDTQPHVLDLRSRGKHLATLVSSPADCRLVALYVPCPISGLIQKLPAGNES